MGESMVADEEGEEGDHGHQLPPEPKTLTSDEFIYGRKERRLINATLWHHSQVTK